MAIMQGLAAYLAKVSGLQTAALGWLGEQLTVDIHGKAYTAAINNRLFVSTTLIAGVTIPVNTATAATCVLHNPLGSGVNMEVFSLDMGWPAAVASTVGTILGTVSTQTPSATTSGGVITALPIGGGGVPQCKFFTAATVVASTTHIPLIVLTGTAGQANPPRVDFDGRLIIAPGGCMQLTSSPVQAQVSNPSFVWAEWPQ